MSIPSRFGTKGTWSLLINAAQYLPLVSPIAGQSCLAIQFEKLSNCCMRFIVALTFVLAAAASADDCAHTPTQFSCVQYRSNYDGDTITFNIPDVHPLFGEKISVRVNGIDTPEIKTKNSCEKSAGRSARSLVENLLKRAKRIDLVNIGRDKYFRILADVVFDGRNLKDVLLGQNLAYAYDGGTKKPPNWCSFGRLPAGK